MAPGDSPFASKLRRSNSSRLSARTGNGLPSSSIFPWSGGASMRIDRPSSLERDGAGIFNAVRSPGDADRRTIDGA